MIKRPVQFLICLLLFFGYFSAVYADIRLPGIMSDNMVLQQSSNVNLWDGRLPMKKLWLPLRGIRVLTP